MENFDLSDPYADCQHVVGGVWGDHLEFMDGTPRMAGYPDEMTDYTIWGHQPATNRVKDGDLITVEYNRNWLTFKARDIEWKSDPKDMFFGKCDLVRVCAKSDGEILYLRDDEEKQEVGVVAAFVRKLTKPFQRSATQ